MESITIKQASQQIFNDLVVIRPTTIQTWIGCGVFTPVVCNPGRLGPGSGSRLDVSDLVTVGLLYSLFSFGARYQQKKTSDRTETAIFNYGSDKKMTFERAIMPTLLNQIDRQIQSFLEGNDFQVIIFWRPDFYPKTSIEFYPASDPDILKKVIAEIFDTETPVRGNLIIHSEAWLKFVLARL